MFDKTKRTEIVVELPLVELMKNSDDNAWEMVFESCSHQLQYDILTSLRKRGLIADHADDIQQQTWLTVVENIDSFEPDTEHSFYHWLRAISFNHVRNLARKRQPDTTLEALDEQSQTSGLTLDTYFFRNDIYADSPERLVGINEQIVTLTSILSDLKPRDREVVLRRFLWEQSPREIAMTWDGSLEVRSISQLLCRLRKSIRLQYNMLAGDAIM